MYDSLFSRLAEQGIQGEQLTEQVAKANIELVLTAHPTEIMRRTLIQKYDQIARLLQQRDDLRENHPEIEQIEQRLGSLIDEIGTPMRFVMYDLRQSTKPSGVSPLLKTPCGMPCLVT